MAMTHLGNGLSSADLEEEALSVKEAELSMLRRLGAPEEHIIVTQSNIANTYRSLGRLEDCLRMRQEIYARRLKISGGEHDDTIRDAVCYATALIASRRFEEAKALMCTTLPAARRVLGESHALTLRARTNYALALHEPGNATLGDLREAVTTLDETERTARRVLGGDHPLAAAIEYDLQNARAALRARETPSSPSESV